VRLDDLASLIGCRLEGDGSTEISGVAGLEQAGPHDVSFFSNPKYTAALKSTHAAAVILGDDVPSPGRVALRTANPYVAFAKALELFASIPGPAVGVDSRSIVGKDVALGKNVAIGPFVCIGDNATVGDGTIIYSHVSIGPGTRVGAGCILYSHVAVRERITIGNRVILHSGVVVGSDGYGFARQSDGTHYKVPQAGTIVIEDDVELGANTAVDRPGVGETRIGAGTKIDNLVQVAHGVHVGARVLLAGQVGIAGSTKIEDDVVLAGQVGVAGHVTIGKGVIATAQTGIPNSVEPGQFISGYPAIPNRDWLKASAVFKKLPELKKTIADLERRVADLEAELARVRGDS
jgi:UDP-3-O-[3-hydroxymyristoyl] glucosamine N-acyltransferase